LAVNPPDGFGANGDKKYTVKYTAGSLMLWAYFIWVLDILYRYMVSWILAITDR